MEVTSCTSFKLIRKSRQLFSQSLKGRQAKSNFSTSSTSALSSGSAQQQQHEQRQQSPQTFSLPIFGKAELYNRVAICDQNGSFLFGDLMSRSLELSNGINDLLGSKMFVGDQQHKIGLLCTNDASFVIAQLSIWLSGHIAVPLSFENHEQAEHAVNATDCSLILTKPGIADQAHALCKKKNVPLICLDDSWTSNPKKEFEVNNHAKMSNIKPDHSSQMRKAMILFEPSSIQDKRLHMVSINHLQLNRQLDHLVSLWDLNEKCSLLHALPNHNYYGNVFGILSSLHAGGKVVMLPHFDTIKVWSYLLGIGVNNGSPLPKVNLYAGLPKHYRRLLERYQQVFKEKKNKDFVRERCKKRLRLTTTSPYENVSPAIQSAWRENTTHEIVNANQKEQLRRNALFQNHSQTFAN